MKKVFLSHSSKDKEFVRKVANIIGLNLCVIDECEFEIGMKNIDEIFKGIGKCDIFVYFISHNSLESDWVKKELNIANDKIINFSEKKMQIYPIIIDPTINFSDERIAEFLKSGDNSYNLRHILKPEIAARKIKTQLIKLEMAQDRIFEERNNYYYGRDEEKFLLKKRIDDVINFSGLRCLVVSGIPGIGRRSFVNAVLKDAGLMEKYYFPIVICLGRTDSIDNFLRLLHNIGIGKYTLDDLSKAISMDEKILILVNMLQEVQKYQEFLVIEDNECLIKINGKLAFWFENAISELDSKLTIAIVSEVRLDEFKYRKRNIITSIELKELSKSDTLGMLRTYSKLEGVPFDNEDREFMSNCLSGYPPQVEYCVDLAKAEGKEYVKNHTDKIADMPEQISSQLIELAYYDFPKKEVIDCILALIVEFGTVPVSLLNKIFKLNKEYSEAFYRIRALSICYFVGNEKEYVKLNSFLHNFIERNKFKVAPDVQNIIQENISAFEKNINDEQYTDELDYTEVSYYIKELLKTEKKIPSRFLYGTIFLQSIISLYNTKQYNKVIRIVKKLIEENDMIFYDDEVEKRIMYYYCLALARMRVPDFGKTVSFFEGNDNYINYNFLRGFYCRILGEFEYAEKFYLNVLKRDPGNLKTRRELVIMYNSNQQYEMARELAQSNYKQNRDNIYYMQAYFDCLINKGSLSDEEEKDMEQIINRVKAIYREIKRNSMYYQILAKFEAFRMNNKDKALNYIKEGIDNNNDEIISYLLKEKFDIYEHFHDIDGMEKTIEALSEELKRQEIDDKRMYNILVGRKALLEAHKGKPILSIEIEIINGSSLSKDAKMKIKNNAEKILAGKSILY